MNNSLKKEIGALAGVISATMFLTACDDEVTKVSKTGIETVVAYEDLTECGDKNDGEMVFVKETGVVYLCSDKKWNDINGSDGKSGSDGKNVTSCTVEALDDGSGYDVLCGGKVVGHLLNGEKGDNGKSCTVKENKEKNGYDLDCGGEVVTVTNGTDGKSAYDIAKENSFNGSKDEWLKSLKGESGEDCTAKSVEDGVEITCGNSDPVVVRNGTNGSNSSDDACKITVNKDGVITLECSEGEYYLRYKALCDGTPYDPETHFCYDNKEVISLCNGQKYDFKKEFCAQRGDAVEGVFEKVKIGQQTWMVQNLNYATENSKCGGGEGTEEGDCAKYGRLYTWTDAVGKTEEACGNGHKCSLPSRVQGICPDGWHLPSQAELEALINKVNTSVQEKDNAGLHLKANSALWIDYEDDNKVTQSGAGDNTSGFTALPGGQYNVNESKFKFSGEAAYFWSSTELSNGSAFYIGVMNDDDEVYQGGSFGKDMMYSVRCLQDEP